MRRQKISNPDGSIEFSFFFFEKKISETDLKFLWKFLFEIMLGFFQKSNCVKILKR